LLTVAVPTTETTVNGDTSEKSVKLERSSRFLARQENRRHSQIEGSVESVGKLGISALRGPWEK
jgi:hypothetical protein